MTDPREPDIPPEEHDEYHSSLEVDDSSGWRVLIIPIVLIVLVIGMIAFFFVYSGDLEPDPRVANHLKAKEEAARREPPPQPAPIPSVPTETLAPEGEPAAPAEEAPEPAG